MSVHRVMGVETEYGIFAPQQPTADSAALSAAVLDAYAAAAAELGHVEAVRWDYSGELVAPEASRVPTWVARLTAQEEVWYRGSSLVLANGSRLYIDHAHPEYASAEVTSPQELVRFDAAGDLMMQRAVEHLARTGADPQIVIYKNNVDGKGAAYGAHENYLVDRAVPFELLTDALLPFLVTRNVYCGAGRVGLGPASEEPGFQIWQRADYVERPVGLETTVKRPIVNTRDEPHADPSRFRRLHVITGDATSAQASTLLKLGTTALLLWVLERRGMPPEWAALELADPVEACRTFSRDLTLRATAPLADGRQLSALQIQRVYLDVIEAELRAADSDPAQDPQTEQVRALWHETLDALETDPWSTADTVEWVAKYVVLSGLAARAGVGWGDARMAAADLQWADVRPGRGIAATMTAQGRLRRIVDEESIATAETRPPSDTRAWLRGEAIRRLRSQVFAASWHSLVFDTGDRLLVRMPMDDPWGYARDEAHPALADGADAEAVLTALTGHARPPKAGAQTH